MINLPNVRYRKIRYLMHALFWSAFVVVGSFILGYKENYPYRFYLINFLVNLPVYALFTYVIVYVLIKKLLSQAQYLIFAFLTVLLLMSSTIIKLSINKFVFYQFFIPKFLHPEVWFNAEFIIISMMWLTAPTVIFAAIKFYKDWVKSSVEKNEIEKRKLESELQLLKAQLNPHFLFNTLNNLYVLALHKDDKTPEVIAKISELFHYILYECNASYVPLEKELMLIQNYIELEQIRYNDRLNVEINKKIENNSYLIPPMMLFTFIENCFKHGSSKEPGASWINITINQKGKTLNFISENSVPEVKNNIEKNNRGVGLANIRRRLELIYPGKYKLQVKDNKSKFVVRLIIKDEYEE
ncbi:sensor histidine kinase [Sunxiuqinia sp. A32]|uniref:sensor histidine kinase n=1 Tax=Sunxiuqinia sp. A32 TaxID=3461496 RepID=UPI0040462703